MADKVGFNINAFIKGSDEEKDLSITKESVVEEKVKKTRTRKPKEEMVPAGTSTPMPTATTSMSYIQENIPYTQAYQETNAQLDESINQLNILGGELFQELQSVRGSKTLRNRFGLINDMTSTASAIISTKLAAIKEKNDTINNVAKLELQRMKELKSRANEDDDNTRIANLYDAFVNTPIGVGPVQLAPPMQNMMMAGGSQDLSFNSIGNSDAAWEQSLDPAQARMLLEARGTVETVVMFDSDSGNRWFEVVDKQTRQPVPGVEKPDATFIYELDLNTRAGIAKDTNRGVVYPLVVLGAGMENF